LSFQLFHQLLGVLKVLLHGWLCLLYHLGQLALSLLANHFQRSKRSNMLCYRISNETLIKLRTGFLLQLLLVCLQAALIDLLVDLHQLMNRTTAGTGLTGRGYT